MGPLPYEASSSATWLAIAAGVKISLSRPASSRHLRSSPFRRTGCSSQRFEPLEGRDLGFQLVDGTCGCCLVQNLFFSSRSTSLSGASSRSSARLQRQVPGMSMVGCHAPQPRHARCRELQSRVGAVSRRSQRPAQWTGKWLRGRTQACRCRIVSAKPTVPARLSFCSASARLNSSRT